MFFLIKKLFLLLRLRRGNCGNNCGRLQFSTSEERRHTLQMGVSIGVPCRPEPGPIVLLSVLDSRVLMAVRQQSLQFTDIVVMQFQFQFQFQKEALLHHAQT
jgi:hypothetical protein